MKSTSENLPAVVERQIQFVPQPLQPDGYTVQAEVETEPTVPLSHYLWILKRQRWKILSFVIAVVIGTAIVSSRLVPVYEATATIDIDRQSPPGIKT